MGEFFPFIIIFQILYDFLVTKIYLLVKITIFFQKLIDMSEKKEQKIVRIPENKLVDLIDNIVTEAVKQKKKEWLAEQAGKDSKNALLESRIAKLEKLLSTAVITRKSK